MANFLAHPNDRYMTANLSSGQVVALDFPLVEATTLKVTVGGVPVSEYKITSGGLQDGQSQAILVFDEPQTGEVVIQSITKPVRNCPVSEGMGLPVQVFNIEVDALIIAAQEACAWNHRLQEKCDTLEARLATLERPAPRPSAPEKRRANWRAQPKASPEGRPVCPPVEFEFERETVRAEDLIIDPSEKRIQPSANPRVKAPVICAVSDRFAGLIEIETARTIPRNQPLLEIPA